MEEDCFFATARNFVPLSRDFDRPAASYGWVLLVTHARSMAPHAASDRPHFQLPVRHRKKSTSQAASLAALASLSRRHYRQLMADCRSSRAPVAAPGNHSAASGRNVGGASSHIFPVTANQDRIGYHRQGAVAQFGPTQAECSSIAKYASSPRTHHASEEWYHARPPITDHPSL